MADQSLVASLGLAPALVSPKAPERHYHFSSFVGWVGVAVQEFFGVVGVVDVGWLGAVGPGQPAGV